MVSADGRLRLVVSGWRPGDSDGARDADGPVGAQRVFVAVVPPPEVCLALADRAARVDLPGRRVAPANLHVTLRFAGEVGAVSVDRWMAELDATDLGPAFRVGLAALGAFPGKRRATVAWAGIGEGHDELVDLAEVVEEAAVDAGLGEEERPFRPHLSLARIRPAVDLRGVAEPGLDDLGWRVTELVLFASERNAGELRYQVLETFPLT